MRPNTPKISGISYPMKNISDRIIQDTIELTLIPGIGIHTRNRVWETIPDISDLFTMDEKFLKTLGISDKAYPAIRSRAYRSAAEEILSWSAREDCRFLVRGTATYPELLEEISDPPLVLYAGGVMEDLKIPRIAVVGSRKPSIYGLQMAEGLASDLAVRGICIVSGLARGIDAAAHRGCIEKGGKTIAVLGCGIDVVYPPEHRQLKDQILRTGLIISEFPPGTAPMPHNFPIRNRIISGLSMGALIVEASEKSGSLITARMALEQNREVFAIPGNITSPSSYGPNFLIKQGAKLVQSWKDVIEEMPGPMRDSIFDSDAINNSRIRELVLISEEEKKLLLLIKLDETIHFDKLYDGGSLSISDLSDKLLNMEIEGWIRRLPGNMYIRTARVPGN